MGKYFLAWILGVPAFVLVLIYFLCTDTTDTSADTGRTNRKSISFPRLD